MFASLFSRSASLFSRSASPVTVSRYRGTAAGWQPIGSRTSYEAAARLRTTLLRIDPAATLRLSV
jgi:hypothetical protein